MVDYLVRSFFTLRSSAHCAVHTLARGVLCLVLVLLLQPLVGMCLLYASGCAPLECCKVDGISFHQRLRGRADISNKAVNHI
jgi:hypothetical protein